MGWQCCPLRRMFKTGARIVAEKIRLVIFAFRSVIVSKKLQTKFPLDNNHPREHFQDSKMNLSIEGSA